jgi:hypothetical protein
MQRLDSSSRNKSEHFLRQAFDQGVLEHDPERCEAVFPRDKREAFARRSCSNDSKKNHPALVKRKRSHTLDLSSLEREASTHAQQSLDPLRKT